MAAQESDPPDVVLITRAVSARRRVFAVQQAAAFATLAAAAAPEVVQSADWDSIASCETGGDWQMSGSTYSGGLGFANTTWTGFGGGEFAANAGDATREQQIIVAERVHARYGLSGWGCRAYG